MWCSLRVLTNQSILLAQSIGFKESRIQHSFRDAALCENICVSNFVRHVFFSILAVKRVLLDRMSTEFNKPMP